MDITERKITKIAREAEKLVLRTMRETGVGTAEIDLIHALRHNPGCTQAALAELLHADKAAIARRTKNLEAKGYLVRRDAPNDRRSQLLYPTEKAESLKSSKAEIEAAFYEYLTDTLTKEEAAAFAAALNKLYAASKAESRALIATSDLLTLKKTIYVANMSENEVNEPESSRHYMAVKTLADSEGSQVIPICAKLEADIAELDDPEEKAMFMEELGVAESGLHKLIKASYTLLGLISFLTAGSDECRAWTIKKGTKAPQAAGKIHTDFERGFIRAEVIAFDDMKACGTMAAAKAKGLVRSEGKEYVMKDGDIVNFLFNV